MLNTSKGSARPEQCRERTATITIPVGNNNGMVLFEDLMRELFRMYNVEKDAKNEAYHFINSRGHFKEYYDWHGANAGKDIDHHAEAVNSLVEWFENEFVEDECHGTK